MFEIPQTTAEFRLPDGVEFTLDVIEAMFEIDGLAGLNAPGAESKTYLQVTEAARPWLSERAGRELTTGEAYTIYEHLAAEFGRIKNGSGP